MNGKNTRVGLGLYLYLSSTLFGMEMNEAKISQPNENIGVRLSNVEAWKKLASVIKADDQSRLAQILEEGISPLVRGNKGVTILHVATGYGKIAIAQWLIKTYPDLLEMTTFQGSTVLHAAVHIGKLETVKWLIQAYPMLVKKVTVTGSSILHVAAQQGYLPVIELLVGSYPELIDMVTTDEKTVLHLAACNGHTAVVAWLVSNDEVIHRLKDRIQSMRVLCDEVRNKGLSAVSMVLSDGIIKMEAAALPVAAPLPIPSRPLISLRLYLTPDEASESQDAAIEGAQETRGIKRKGDDLASEKTKKPRDAQS